MINDTSMLDRGLASVGGQISSALLAQHLIELPADAHDRKALFDVAAATTPECVAQSRSVEQPGDCLGEGHGIAPRHDETATIAYASDDIPHRRNVAADNR